METVIISVLVGSAAGYLVASRVAARSASRIVAAAVPVDSGATAPAQPSFDSSSVLDAIPLGVVVVDGEGRELVRNAAANAFTGTRHQDVLLDGVLDRLVKSALAGDTTVEEVRLAGPPERIVVVTATPFGDARAVATMEDITEQRLVDQVRTDFVANVSHELKTPVGAISILAETLEAETEDELAKRLAGRMVLESQRMSQTIEDLLELSRIEMGGEMLTAPVSVNAVVAEAVERASSHAQAAGVAIETAAPQGDVTVLGDRFQLVSAIGNIVENAVKYSDGKGPVTVTVKPSPVAVDIEISDHGIGIPAASLDRVFERFYRVDRSRGRTTGGTGLGLSIVRRVTTNHGGEVNVRSREGEGSTFTVHLPRNVDGPAGIMSTDDEREPRDD